MNLAASMVNAVPDDPDTELALRWKAGDPAAYRGLVERNLDPVRKFLLSRCGNEADADDLAQEVFFTVCQKIQNYDPSHPFRAWLYTVARRTAVDFWRRHRATEVYHPEYECPDVRDPGKVHDEEEGGREAWAKVRRLLPEAQATALWFQVQEELSLQEIAERMGVTLSNVKVMVFRARQKLAREWHAEEA